MAKQSTNTDTSTPVKARGRPKAEPEPKVEFDPDKVYALAAHFQSKSERMKFVQWLVGTSPLICHAFPQKAKQEILAKQTKSRVDKKPRQPAEDFEASLYPYGVDGVYGFPVNGIKKSITSSAHKDKGLAKAGAAGVLSNLWVHGKMVNLPTALPGAICSISLCRIWSDAPPLIREDTVRLARSTTSLGYRGQFNNWAIRIEGNFNPNVIAPSTLTSLMEDGGSGFGLGDWRNEKQGVFGSYRLAGKAEMDEWERFARGQGPFPTWDAEVVDVDAWLEAAE